MASKIREDPLFIIRYCSRGGKGLVTQMLIVLPRLAVLLLCRWFLFSFYLPNKRICLHLCFLMMRMSSSKGATSGLMERYWQMHQTRLDYSFTSGP
jgi:hypothetical protein